MVVPTHTHKFEVRFNDEFHWKECTICQPGQTFTSLDGTKFGEAAKEVHVKHDNGGSYNNCSTYTSNNHRKTCNCGWDSGPFLLIHGRPYNFTKGENSSCRTDYAIFYLRDLERITYQEFLDKGLNTYRVNGQLCEWSNLKDNTHNGYGWVFCGGLIDSGDGRIGSVRYIEGGNWTSVSKGSTVSRSGELDEMFILLKYVKYNGSRSRQGFINWVRAQANAQSHIKNNINNSRHLLSNIIDKYSSMPDANFNKIMACANGYSLYYDTANIHSSGMAMACYNHKTPGSIYIQADYCYDSSTDRIYSYSNGLYCNCDVCGKQHTGLEEYGGETYVIDAVWDIKPNTSRTCAGHRIKTVVNGSVIEGCAVYHTYTRDSSHGITVYARVVDSPGFSHAWTHNNSTGDLTYSYSMPENKNENAAWDWPYRFSLRYNGSHKLYVSTGRKATFNDYVAPVAYGHSGNTTSNNYWKVTGNGTPERHSTYAVLDIAFRDDLLYTYNQVSASVYEKVIKEDGREEYQVLKQADGNTWVPLKMAPGTNNIWIGQLQILTEVNGEKDVYVKAKDNTYNESGYIPMKISYLDSKGPTINARVEYDKSVEPWATTRDIIVEGYDAFGTVLLGYRGDDGGMISVPTVNGWGQRRYRFTGDLDGDKTIKFYAIDQSGNLSELSVVMSNLDNTAPTISNIDMERNGNGVDLRVYAHDKNHTRNTSGSGVVAYGISKSKDISNIEWTDSTESSKVYSIDKAGEYYFWAKDALGHISKGKKVTTTLYREKDSCDPEIIPEIGRDTLYDKVDYGEDFVVKGFTLQGWLKAPEGGFETASEINFKLYYRRNRYDIEYVGNRQTKGETYVQHIMWGQDFTVLDNRFERIYKYNLKAEDDSRLDGDTTQELEAEIEGGITQLVETWKFQNWYFDNKKDSNRLESRTYLPGEVIDTDDKHLTLKDGDVLVFSVQWDPGKVTLPNVKRIGSDFIGWFNKEQIIGSTVLEARMLGKNETLTLDDLERRHIQDYDSNKEFTLYAWYNKKPIFVNIYDGVFFEGQKVTYTDLLELIGVWDYDDNYQELQLDNINSHFDNLIEIVDNDIKTDKEELDYLIEELKDSEDERLTDDIKELREHLKELFEERNEIQKARRKATQEVKVRVLEPRIAKIEYGAKEDEDYYDPRFGYEEVDYHTDKISSNGLYEAKTPEEAGISYTDELLNTSTDKIGLVRITYQVHDKGIWYTDWSALDNEDDGQYEGLGDDFEHSDTAGAQIFIPNSDITLEYTRVCEIDFNYNPLLNLQNVLEYSEFNFDKDLSKYLLDRQVLRDSEDLQDNIPWWSKKAGDVLHKDINEQTQKKLQDSIIISGISEITLNGTFEYEHPVEAAQFKLEYTSPEGDKNDENDTRVIKLDSGLYDKSNIVKEIGDFQGNNEAYGNVTKNDIWMNITSIGITYDGYDQFGKCASNKVTNDRKVDEHYKVNTDQRPIGYIPKYNSGFNVDESSVDYDLRIYQTPFERTVYLVLVNIDNDSSLAYARSKDKVRYINDKYLSKLKDSYWGTTGLEDITKIMDKAKFPGDDYSDYEGNYINKKGTDIKVNVKDYTE